jgi:hypothetical protein
MVLFESVRPQLQFTSPRLRGEVGAQRRVRGTLHQHSAWRFPLTLTLSPQAGRGNDIERL